MDFFDFAWSTIPQITKKTHTELKILLHNDLRYPYLGKDSRGFVLHLIIPKKPEDKHACFQGLKFDFQDPSHKKIIWYLFKASVYHLAMHSRLSDFPAYSKWARGKHLNLSTFVVSLIEDAMINQHLLRSFRWLLPEVVFANCVSFLRMKSFNDLPNDASRLMCSVLLATALKKTKGNLNDETATDVEAITSILRKIGENPTFDERIDAATKIYDTITIYGETFEVPSLLYAESHGTNDLFYERCIPKDEEIQQLLSEALASADHEIQTDEQRRVTLQNLKENEAFQALATWQDREAFKQKILKGYATVGKNTQFEDFEFPVEDYAEYQRRREFLSSPIRRVLHQLRLLKNVGGDDFRQESGFIDLQEAIQVIASKSQRTDVFAREELQTREDAWSILIDASHSLNMFNGEVRGIALCLAEVAKMLILDQNSWGIYAFNNKFYVVKDFSEGYGVQVKARVGGLTHGSFTYLPDAILLAAQALRKRIEEARVLVVVSDFFPAGYENVEEKLKENIKEIERMGVSIIGVGVRSRAVKNYIRTSCVVENPYDLMKKFIKVFMGYSAG